MKRPRKTGLVRDERGIALLVALAVLVLMAILAVSFYTSQDIESMAAANAQAQRSAEAVAESGLEWAMALVESDLHGGGNNVVLGYDTDFHIWGARAKSAGAGYPNEVLLDGTDVDLSDLDNPDVNDSRWITVRTADRVVGRMAILIEDEDGKANLNVVGTEGDLAKTNNTGDGLSPAEVSLQTILSNISGADSAWADAMIRTRNGANGTIDAAGIGGIGYPFCDDDLNGVVDDPAEGDRGPDRRNLYALAGDDIALLDLSTAFKDIAGSTDQKRAWLKSIRGYVTVNSRTQNMYKLHPADDSISNDWADQLCINTADGNAIRAKLSDLQTAGRLPAVSSDVLDQIAANIADFIDKDSDPTRVGTKYGVEKTPYVNEVESSPQPPSFPTGPNGEPIYDYGEYIELINPYDVDVPVKLVNVPKQDGSTQDIQVTVPKRTDDNTPGFYVITDISGHYTDANTGADVPRTDLAPRPSVAPDPGWDLGLSDSSTLTLQTSGGVTIEVAHYTSAGSDNDQTSQKNDPRVDEWATGVGTPKAQNSNWSPDTSGDNDSGLTLAQRFVVFDGELGSVGDLGQVHAGAQWATIDLRWDPTWNEDYHTAVNQTWLNVYDVFTTQDPVKNAAYGLININTAPKAVLLGLKGVDSGIADAIINHVTNSRAFESVGELGYFLTGLTPSTTSWDREKHLSDIAGLVTVRACVFRVTVLAQAVDRQGNPIGERKLEASVERKIVGGQPKVHVISMRWLVED